MSEESTTQEGQQEGQQEVTSTPEQQAEARQFGWVPKDEFKGRETDWRDADAFLERGKEINGFLRKDLETIKTLNQTQREELEEIRETVKQFKEYHSKTEQRAYEKAMKDLRKQKAEAIELQDGQAVVKIEEAMDGLKDDFTSKAEPTKETKETKPAQDDAAARLAYIQWAKENTWYVTNPELKAEAELFGEEVKITNPSAQGREFLDLVTSKMKEKYPDLSKNPARNNSAVGTSGESRADTSNKGKKTFNDLPAEAKAACNKFVKQGLLTKEQYVAEYDWSE